MVWRTLPMLLCLSLSPHTPAMDADEEARLREAVRDFEEAVEDLAQGPDGTRLRRTLQEAEGRSREHLARESAILAEDQTDPDAIRARLGAALRASIGAEAADEIEAQVFFPSDRQDPEGRMTFATGDAGILWAFWAKDAPNVNRLANVLARLERARPEVRVADVHIMPWSVWKQELAGLAEVRDFLAFRDPMTPDEEEVASKQAIFDAVYADWSGFTDMAQTRRHGGVLLFEDASPAVLLGIQRLPSFAFISPQYGNIHTLRGIPEDLDLDRWIQRCLDWEQENRDVIEMRLGRSGAPVNGPEEEP